MSYIAQDIKAITLKNQFPRIQQNNHDPNCNLFFVIHFIHPFFFFFGMHRQHYSLWKGVHIYQIRQSRIPQPKSITCQTLFYRCHGNKLRFHDYKNYRGFGLKAMSDWNIKIIIIAINDFECIAINSYWMNIKQRQHLLVTGNLLNQMPFVNFFSDIFSFLLSI